MSVNNLPKPQTPFYFDSSNTIDKNASKPVADISERMKEFKQLLSRILTQVTAINEIHSAKILINFNLDDKKINNDYIIKKKDVNSEFTSEILTKKIDLLVTDLLGLIQIQDFNSTELSIKWEVFIKSYQTSFTRFHGLIRVDSSSKTSNEGVWRNIPSKLAEKTFELILKEMNREVVPQLNDQFEFV